MRVPVDRRAGALIAAASRGSLIKRQSTGGAAEPSCRAVMSRRVPDLLPPGSPFNKCFCLSTAGSAAARAPGAPLAPRAREGAIPLQGGGCSPSAVGWQQQWQPRDGREHPALRSGPLAMLNLITLSQCY